MNYYIASIQTGNYTNEQVTAETIKKWFPNGEIVTSGRRANVTYLQVSGRNIARLFTSQVEHFEYVTKMGLGN